MNPIISLTDLTATCVTCGGEGHKADKRTDGNWTDGVCDWCVGRGWVLDPDRLLSGAAVLCSLDNTTGPDVAVEAVPCDVHRKTFAAALLAYMEPPT